MEFELPPLPYPMNALEPYISARTLETHYGKHHQGYLDKVKAAIGNTEQARKPLTQIIAESSGMLFNNAAQVWNHTFYPRFSVRSLNPIRFEDLS